MARPEKSFVADRTPFTLKAYQVVTAMAVPLADVLLKLRLKRGKEHPERLPERRGQSSTARPVAVQGRCRAGPLPCRPRPG